jgi:hypothetical protein
VVACKHRDGKLVFIPIFRQALPKTTNELGIESKTNCMVVNNGKNPNFYDLYDKFYNGECRKQPQFSDGQMSGARYSMLMII